MVLRSCATLLVCLAPALAEKQSVAAWPQAGTVAAGATVRVDTAESRRTGTLESITDDSIRLRSKGQPLTIARAEVRRLYTQSGSRRLRNLLIGTGVGVAAGAVLYGTLGELFRNETGDAPGLLFLPIAIGAGVGAAMPARGWKKIYENKP